MGKRIGISWWISSRTSKRRLSRCGSSWVGQGQHPIAPRDEREALQRIELAGAFEVREKGIDHHVSGEVDPARIDAFAEQILLSGALGHEEPGGDGIGEEPVDLFGHGAIEGAKAGLHVGDRDAQLDRGQGRGEGGVDVSHHDQGARTLLGDHRLDPLQDLGGHLRMRARAHAQVRIGRGDPEVIEEVIRHGGVVVLAGVDQEHLELIPGTQLPKQGCDFHEVRAGGSHCHHPHRALRRLLHRLLSRGCIEARSCAESAPSGGRLPRAAGPPRQA
jgi:hypothetical protein